MVLPIILITPGDPAGIGPEITLKAISDYRLNQICNPVLVGDASILRQAASHLKLENCIHIIKDLDQAIFQKGKTNIIDISTGGIKELEPGKIQAVAARSAVLALNTAVDMALHGRAEALVTGPINKRALKLAGYHWAGHTEMLQEVTRSRTVMTMFVARRLRIFFATRHLSLRHALAKLRKAFLYQTIVNVNCLMKTIGFQRPRLGIAGLNPHAGEEGLFGFEEIKEIEPAVKKAQEEGVYIMGPFAADSIFHLCIRGLYDAVIALTHDQGHIAAKTYDFYRTVSVTLGLPFIRTSVDHGTAFDIAWQWKADPTSMKEAIKVAVTLVKKWKLNKMIAHSNQQFL